MVDTYIHIRWLQMHSWANIPYIKHPGNFMIPSTASSFHHDGFGFLIAIRECSLPYAADL